MLWIYPSPPLARERNLRCRQDSELGLSVRNTTSRRELVHSSTKLVSWCFESSQLLGVTLGLNTNSNLSHSCSAHKSLNISHNISTASYFKHTHTHKITHISTKPHTFCITVKIFLHTKFTSKYLILHSFIEHVPISFR